MGKRLVIKDADFSSAAIVLFTTGVLTKNDFNEQLSDADSLLRCWGELPEPLDAGVHNIGLRIKNYSSPNTPLLYAWAIRLVESNTARTGVDLLVVSDSSTITETNIAESADVQINSQNRFLYVNINNKTASVNDLEVEVIIND